VGYRLLARGLLSRPFTGLARALSMGDRRASARERVLDGVAPGTPSAASLCSFGALHYELGDLRDIGEIEGVDPNAGYMKVLRDGRVRCFSHSGLPPLDLAARCMHRTLEESGCTPADVDVLVLASDRLLETSSYPRLSELMTRLGLSRASIIGVGLSGCTNATVALRTAAALQSAEALGHILVVSVDTLPPDVAHRVQPQGTCVFSDAAVSFMVGPSGRREFDVLGIEHEPSHHIGLLDLQGDSIRAIRESLSGPRAAVQRLLARAGVRPGQVHKLFAANFVYGVALAQARMCGFRESQCFFDNLPRFGHTYAGDPFIGLEDYTTANRQDGLFLLLGSFTTSWGAVLVRRSSTTV
jgi:3-oxoacyl-[acyl-carrier-protein] synthase III